MANIENNLFNDNIKLVHHIINRHFRGYSTADKDDLIQEGLLALFRSSISKSFDETKGTKFSTFAYKSILNSCIKYVQKLHKKQKNLALIDPINIDLMISNNQGHKEYEILEYLKESLTKNEFNIIKLRLSKYTYSEIADYLGCSKQNIHQGIIKKCRNLLKS